MSLNVNAQAFVPPAQWGSQSTVVAPASIPGQPTSLSDPPMPGAGVVPKGVPAQPQSSRASFNVPAAMNPSDDRAGRGTTLFQGSSHSAAASDFATGPAQPPVTSKKISAAAAPFVPSFLRQLGDSSTAPPPAAALESTIAPVGTPTAPCRVAVFGHVSMRLSTSLTPAGPSNVASHPNSNATTSGTRLALPFLSSLLPSSHATQPRPMHEPNVSNAIGELASSPMPSPFTVATAPSAGGAFAAVQRHVAHAPHLHGGFICIRDDWECATVVAEGGDAATEAARVARLLEFPGVILSFGASSDLLLQSTPSSNKSSPIPQPSTSATFSLQSYWAALSAHFFRVGGKKTTSIGVGNLLALSGDEDVGGVVAMGYFTVQYRQFIFLVMDPSSDLWKAAPPALPIEHRARLACDACDRGRLEWLLGVPPAPDDGSGAALTMFDRSVARVIVLRGGAVASSVVRYAVNNVALPSGLSGPRQCHAMLWWDDAAIDATASDDECSGRVASKNEMPRNALLRSSAATFQLRLNGALRRAAGQFSFGDDDIDTNSAPNIDALVVDVPFFTETEGSRTWDPLAAALHIEAALNQSHTATTGRCSSAIRLLVLRPVLCPIRLACPVSLPPELTQTEAESAAARALLYIASEFGLSVMPLVPVSAGSIFDNHADAAQTATVAASRLFETRRLTTLPPSSLTELAPLRQAAAANPPKTVTAFPHFPVVYVTMGSDGDDTAACIAVLALTAVGHVSAIARTYSHHLASNSVIISAPPVSGSVGSTSTSYVSSSTISTPNVTSSLVVAGGTASEAITALSPSAVSMSSTTPPQGSSPTQTTTVENGRRRVVIAPTPNQSTISAAAATPPRSVPPLATTTWTDPLAILCYRQEAEQETGGIPSATMLGFFRDQAGRNIAQSTNSNKTSATFEERFVIATNGATLLPTFQSMRGAMAVVESIAKCFAMTPDGSIAATTRTIRSTTAMGNDDDRRSDDQTAPRSSALSQGTLASRQAAQPRRSIVVPPLPHVEALTRANYVQALFEFAGGLADSVAATVMGGDERELQQHRVNTAVASAFVARRQPTGKHVLVVFDTEGRMLCCRRPGRRPWYSNNVLGSQTTTTEAAATARHQLMRTFVAWTMFELPPSCAWAASETPPQGNGGFTVLEGVWSGSWHPQRRQGAIKAAGEEPQAAMPPSWISAASAIAKGVAQREEGEEGDTPTKTAASAAGEDDATVCNRFASSAARVAGSLVVLRTRCQRRHQIATAPLLFQSKIIITDVLAWAGQSVLHETFLSRSSLLEGGDVGRGSVTLEDERATAFPWPGGVAVVRAFHASVADAVDMLHRQIFSPELGFTALGDATSAGGTLTFVSLGPYPTMASSGERQQNSDGDLAVRSRLLPVQRRYAWTPPGSTTMTFAVGEIVLRITPPAMPPPSANTSETTGTSSTSAAWASYFTLTDLLAIIRDEWTGAHHADQRDGNGASGLADRPSEGDSSMSANGMMGSSEEPSYTTPAEYSSTSEAPPPVAEIPATNRPPTPAEGMKHSVLPAVSWLCTLLQRTRRSTDGTHHAEAKDDDDDDDDDAEELSEDDTAEAAARRLRLPPLRSFLSCITVYMQLLCRRRVEGNNATAEQGDAEENEQGDVQRGEYEQFRDEYTEMPLVDFLDFWEAATHQSTSSDPREKTHKETPTVNSDDFSRSNVVPGATKSLIERIERALTGPTVRDDEETLRSSLLVIGSEDAASPSSSAASMLLCGFRLRSEHALNPQLARAAQRRVDVEETAQSEGAPPHPTLAVECVLRVHPDGAHWWDAMQFIPVSRRDEGDVDDSSAATMNVVAVRDAIDAAVSSPSLSESDLLLLTHVKAHVCRGCGMVSERGANVHGDAVGSVRTATGAVTGATMVRLDAGYYCSGCLAKSFGIGLQCVRCGGGHHSAIDAAMGDDGEGDDAHAEEGVLLRNGGGSPSGVGLPRRVIRGYADALTALSINAPEGSSIGSEDFYCLTCWKHLALSLCVTGPSAGPSPPQYTQGYQAQQRYRSRGGGGGGGNHQPFLPSHVSSSTGGGHHVLAGPMRDIAFRSVAVGTHTMAPKPSSLDPTANGTAVPLLAGTVGTSSALPLPNPNAESPAGVAQLPRSLWHRWQAALVGDEAATLGASALTPVAIVAINNGAADVAVECYGRCGSPIIALPPPASGILSGSLIGGDAQLAESIAQCRVRLERLCGVQFSSDGLFNPQDGGGNSTDAGDQPSRRSKEQGSGPYSSLSSIAVEQWLAAVSAREVLAGAFSVDNAAAMHTAFSPSLAAAQFVRVAQRFAIAWAASALVSAPSKLALRKRLRVLDVFTGDAPEASAWAILQRACKRLRRCLLLGSAMGGCRTILNTQTGALGHWSDDDADDDVDATILTDDITDGGAGHYRDDPRRGGANKGAADGFPAADGGKCTAAPSVLPSPTLEYTVVDFVESVAENAKRHCEATTAVRATPKGRGGPPSNITGAMTIAEATRAPSMTLQTNVICGDALSPALWQTVVKGTATPAAPLRSERVTPKLDAVCCIHPFALHQALTGGSQGHPQDDHPHSRTVDEQAAPPPPSSAPSVAAASSSVAQRMDALLDLALNALAPGGVLLLTVIDFASLPCTAGGPQSFGYGASAPSPPPSTPLSVTMSPLSAKGGMISGLLPKTSAAHSGTSPTTPASLMAHPPCNLRIELVATDLTSTPPQPHKMVHPAAQTAVSPPPLPAAALRGGAPGKIAGDPSGTLAPPPPYMPPSSRAQPQTAPNEPPTPLFRPCAAHGSIVKVLCDRTPAAQSWHLDVAAAASSFASASSQSASAMERVSSTASLDEQAGTATAAASSSMMTCAASATTTSSAKVRDVPAIDVVLLVERAAAKGLVLDPIASGTAWELAHQATAVAKHGAALALEGLLSPPPPVSRGGPADPVAAKRLLASCLSTSSRNSSLFNSTLASLPVPPLPSLKAHEIAWLRLHKVLVFRRACRPALPQGNTPSAPPATTPQSSLQDQETTQPLPPAAASRQGIVQSRGGNAHNNNHSQQTVVPPSPHWLQSSEDDTSSSADDELEGRDDGGDETGGATGYDDGEGGRYQEGGDGRIHEGRHSRPNMGHPPQGGSAVRGGANRFLPRQQPLHNEATGNARSYQKQSPLQGDDSAYMLDVRGGGGRGGGNPLVGPTRFGPVAAGRGGAASLPTAGSGGAIPAPRSRAPPGGGRGGGEAPDTTATATPQYTSGEGQPPQRYGRGAAAAPSYTGGPRGGGGNPPAPTRGGTGPGGHLTTAGGPPPPSSHPRSANATPPPPPPPYAPPLPATASTGGATNPAAPGPLPQPRSKQPTTSGPLAGPPPPFGATATPSTPDGSAVSSQGMPPPPSYGGVTFLPPPGNARRRGA